MSYIRKNLPPIILTVLVIAISFPYLQDMSADAEWYLMIAEGSISKVNSPFSSRVLLPYTSKVLSNLLNISIDSSFLYVNVFSLSALVIAFSKMYERYNGFAPIYIPIIFSPFLVYVFESYRLPDLFYFMFLLFLLISVIYDRIILYTIFLLALFLTRGASTILVSVFVASFFYMKDDRKFLYITVVMSSIGLVGSAMLGSRGAGNPHNMNSIAYVLGKIPFNFLKNYGGLAISTNTLAKAKEGMLLSFSIPKFLPTGSVEELYIYSFDPRKLVRTFVVMLSTFGVLPSLLISDVRDYGKRLFTSTPLFFSFSLSYGVVSFFLAPCLGASVYRLVGYGWPAFWIAAGLLVQAHHTDRNTKWLVVILVVNLLTMWISFLLFGGLSPQPSFYLLPLIIMFHLVSYVIYDKYMKRDVKFNSKYKFNLTNAT